MGNNKNYEPYIFKTQGTYFKISALYFFCCFKCLKNNVLKNRRKMGVLCCMNTAEI